MIEVTPAAPRVGEVDDIAPLVAFLCTEEAKWTTVNIIKGIVERSYDIPD